MPGIKEKGTRLPATGREPPITKWKAQGATKNSSQDSFVYDQLEGKYPIRTIMVLPDLSPEGFLQCNIQHTTFYHDFTCLSYTWGRRTKSHQILLNGKSFFVRENLLKFLEVCKTQYGSSAKPIKKCWHILDTNAFIMRWCPLFMAEDAHQK
jgi:hypothetical protein